LSDPSTAPLRLLRGQNDESDQSDPPSHAVPRAVL